MTILPQKPAFRWLGKIHRAGLHVLCGEYSTSRLRAEMVLAVTVLGILERLPTRLHGCRRFL
jgi:hypothetical protein